MTKIILMRHGKPLLPGTGWIAPAEMGRWIESYNRSEIAAESIPAISLDLASSASCVAAR